MENSTAHPDYTVVVEPDRGQGKETELAAQVRSFQYAEVAGLSGRALAGLSIEVVMQEAVEAVAGSLGTECGVIFGVRGDDLVVVAGSGSGSGSPPVGDPLARHTLDAGDPVVVDDLRSETRFATSAMIERGWSSALSARIVAGGEPYGVLAAYTSRSNHFSIEDGHFVQAVANVVGMAIERHRHGEALERANQQERLAVVGQLAAGVAHDFNNIVAAISLYAELLETQQSLDDAGRGYVHAVRQQVERGTSLVWQVLDFAHRSSLDLTDVDLAGFLDQLVPLLRRSLPPHARLILAHDGRPYPVRADGTRLQQIFMNLVSNAKHAIGGSGLVTITLSRHGVDGDQASPLDNPLCRPSVRIDLEDNGAGMSPAVLARAFEPFFTTKSPGQGTGLGLAQVHGLVDQHDGHIDVVSTPGEGTRVSIWLPAPETTSVAHADAPAEIPRGRGERVLVVDDDPAMRAAMARVVNWLGYSALVADSGEAACGILAGTGSSVAVVVSDIRMPGMGGESLAQAVAHTWPDVSVILVSGYPIRAQSEPADPVSRRPVTRLLKPFSSRQLAAAMETALVAGAD